MQIDFIHLRHMARIRTWKNLQHADVLEDYIGITTDTCTSKSIPGTPRMNDEDATRL